MSLINQMLQDLEQRQSVETTRSTLGETQAPPFKARNAKVWKITVGLLLLVVLGMSWALFQSHLHKMASESVASNTVIQKTVPAPSNQVVVLQPVPTRVPVTPPASEPPPIPAAPIVTSAPVEVAVAKNPEPEKAVVPPLPATQVIQQAPVKVTAAKEKHNARQHPEVLAPQVVQVRDAAAANTDINKQMRQATPQQKAENEYRKASNLLNQGRIEDAIDGYRSALQISPTHEASRQALLAVLVESKRLSEAQAVLQEALQRDVNQPAYAMALARLDVEKGQTQTGLEVLQATAPYALNNAQYQAFMATLNQRQGRHKEAVEHYQTALRLSPQTGVWWMGIGISLQALERMPEALEAFNRAKAAGGLSTDLIAFVDQRLRQLQKTVR